MGPVLIWLPKLAWGALVVLALGRYIAEHAPEARESRFFLRFDYRTLAWAAIGVRILFALLFSVGQYYVWTTDAFTQTFLHAAVNPQVREVLVQWFPWIFGSPLGYFFFYSWGRFWFNVVISVGVAALFRWFLMGLQRYRERFFEPGEVDLGFLAALAAGWPNVVIFLPIAFVSVLLLSVARGIVWHKAYTTLGAPFLLAMLVTLAWGSELIGTFGLTVLHI